MKENVHRFVDSTLPESLRGKTTKFFNGKKHQPYHNGVYVVKVVNHTIFTSSNNSGTTLIRKKAHVQFYFSRFENGKWYCAAKYIETAATIRQPSMMQDRDWQGLVEEFK